MHCLFIILIIIADKVKDIDIKNNEREKEESTFYRYNTSLLAFIDIILAYNTRKHYL